MSAMIFVAVGCCRSIATLMHLLFRSFWAAVTASAVTSAWVVLFSASTHRGAVDPFDNLASVFAGVYGAAISTVVGGAVMLLRRNDAADREPRSRFNGR